MSIELAIEGRVASVTFCRAAQGNAMTAIMIDTLLDVLGRATREADVLVMRGEGPDFCLGRDRAEPPTGKVPFDAFRPIVEINRTLSEFPGISIVAVQGRARGFGVGLVTRADIAIAADDARFSLDEIKHDIAPMFILSGLLDHLAPKHAADLVFGGSDIDAQTALTHGLVSRVVKAGALEGTIDALRDNLVACDPSVLRASKAYFSAIPEVPRAVRPAYALKAQIDSLRR